MIRGPAHRLISVLLFFYVVLTFFSGQLLGRLRLRRTSGVNYCCLCYLICILHPGENAMPDRDGLITSHPRPDLTLRLHPVNDEGWQEHVGVQASKRDKE
jgi:hypothetical protein